MKPFYVLGLDPGQAHDPTALALIEWNRRDEPIYHLRALHRFPLGTPYTELPAALIRRLTKEPLAGRLAVAIDATGVGAPVVDHFRQQISAVPIYAITITAGTTVSGKGKAPHVPKLDLIQTSSVIFEQRRIRIAANMRETNTLREELLAYRRNSEHGHDTFAAASGSHDDLVLALSLAPWTAENKDLVPRTYHTQLSDVRLPTVDEMIAARQRSLYNWNWNA